MHKSRIALILLAMIAALSLWLGMSVGYADAATKKTTHCGVKTTWRFIGEDENGIVKVRGWWKPSSIKGKVAICGEGWDVDKLPDKAVRIMIAPDNYAAQYKTGGNSVWHLMRVPTKDLNTVLVQANVGPWAAYTQKRF